ncbi:hypothetical protein ILUMI_08478, partial [Ignelater luminosus]
MLPNAYDSNALKLFNLNCKCKKDVSQPSKICYIYPIIVTLLAKSRQKRPGPLQYKVVQRPWNEYAAINIK